MSGSKILFDYRWNVDKYKDNYDSEHWNLCRAFMETHKTKYPEQKLAHLTEAFYQIGVYGSSYDPKTTRLVNALTVEVLDNVLKSHPGVLNHPFKNSAVVLPESSPHDKSEPTKENKDGSQPSSIWDVQVDQTIIANVLLESQLKELFKGFVIIYDIRRASTMNDNKVTILEESFKRSKFGPCHWSKDVTQNNICPIRMALKWRNVVLAEAVGSDEKSLKTRLAQAVLSKMANFSSGVEAKWSYYRDGRLPDRFENPNPRKSHIYRVLGRYQFKDMAEITSYIDTFANSDSFAEVGFSMDFSNQEKKQLMEYIDKNWCTKLTYRTLSKAGVKNKSDSHVFVYHIRSGEELRRWLEQTDGENDRYRLVAPGKHRRAGTCDNNVREVLTTDAVELPKEARESRADNLPSAPEKPGGTKEADDKVIKEIVSKGSNRAEEKVNKETEKTEDTSKKTGGSDKKENETVSDSKKVDANKKEVSDLASGDEDDLEKLLDGFVLFYDANRTSEIDKDDWFTALCESFKLSKFGPLDVIIESVRPLRTRCVLKWKEKILAEAEGLTETQAKTAATLQLISKLEPFTYIIQAKEEYFCGGKVPPFIENPDKNKSDFCRVVLRKDLPSYYLIFQTIDNFARDQTQGEMVFGPDFTWELKNEIVVYLKAKGLSHRYFTLNDEKPWTHMAIYQTVKPEELKEHLLKAGGENDKYKLIPPPKAEPIGDKTPEEPKVKSTKDAGKPTAPTAVAPAAKKPLAKVVEKRKPEKEPTPPPLPEELDSSKIQIKLKKFKVDKVDFPEDTGGDFPGLIIWIGIKKNSVWQKNIFNILLDSFKMSKYGELIIEESEESVWGRKEPLKKCVIKSSRKVLAVGLGESKTEAKNSASLQVLRQLRKHCYTIQAKESYFKEGKATPYAFNPDPAKAHVYKVPKRNSFKDRAAMIKFVNDFAKENCTEEVIFGDDFSYDEREFILDHCRKINLNYRLMKCMSSSKTMHTHVAIYHQQPLPVIKAELMAAGGENDLYRLVPPGGKITNQNTPACKERSTEDLKTEDLKRRLIRCGGEDEHFRLIPPGMWDFRDLWPDTLENGLEGPTEEEAQSTQNLSSQNNFAYSNKPQPSFGEQIPRNSNPIPSLINRVPIAPSDPKGKAIDNFAPTVKVVNEINQDGKKVSVNILENNSGRTLVEINPQKVAKSPEKSNDKLNSDGSTKPAASPKPPKPLVSPKVAPKSQDLSNQQVGPQNLPNQPIESKSLHNQSVEPQPLSNQIIGPQPMHSQPMGLQDQNNQPIGPQPQFVMAPQVPTVEVPFGPQPLYNLPPPPMYNQPFMDTPLQFGPNPPVYIPQQPCDFGPMAMNNIAPTVSMAGNDQMPNNAGLPNQTQIAVPSVTITVPNSPQKSDLREELAKKRQAENRTSSPDRVVIDVSTSRRVINTEENNSDGWSRKVFVAEPGSSAEQEAQRRDVKVGAGPKEKVHDLREKLRHKDPSEERIPRRNSPPRNFQNRMRRGSPEQRFNAGGPGRRRSPNFNRQRISPERNRNGNVSRERWRSRDQSPEQRIIRHRDSSHERRVFHNSARNAGNQCDRVQPGRFRSRSRSRSFSPRRPGRSPSPTVVYRDLWDNIPSRLSEHIFMYKYVKQDSTTESDPYALLRATRSPVFNVDFDFIKEQTAIDEWCVSVELVTDNANIHPLVGEGMARTEKEASRRAALHAVDTVQKACRVIEPNYRYFCNGGVPEFIARKSPMKTSVYEIIQNMDPGTPLARYTVEMMFKMFISSDLEDIFFLSSDFSYVERVLVIEMATQMNLWWRLFGPRHPSARPDDRVSTQHVCVFKQKSALQLIQELIARGAYSEKYTLVDPREYRLTRPRFNR